MVLDPAERRRRVGATISRVVLIHFRAAHSAYNRGRMSPELFTAMAIRMINVRCKAAASISQIMAATSFPRTTVRRHIGLLRKGGVIIEEAPSHERYSIHPDWSGGKVEARHIRVMRRAILAAARALERDE